MLEKNENLKQWEKVSAAIGYAEYESMKDSSITDVFKRADQKMYEDKKEMKAKMGEEVR
jgi:GGDEF domain-containing protein